MDETKTVPFDQILFQLFFDLVRSSGQGMNLDQIEKVRSASTRMSAIIDAQVRLLCYENLKTLQENAQAAIGALEEKVGKLDTLPPAGNTSGGVTKKHFRDLEERVYKLEHPIDPEPGNSPALLDISGEKTDN